MDESRPEMSDDAATWALIHAERKALAATIEALTAEQWLAQSLCQGWTVGFAAAHVLAGAEQTQGHFVRGMAASGFRFNAFMDKDARSRSQLTAQQIADRLRLRSTTTNHPPAPVVAMLGEVIVHGEDIRRPAGLEGTVADDAADACLLMYTKSSFPVGGKNRIQGLRLVASRYRLVVRLWPGGVRARIVAAAGDDRPRGWAGRPHRGRRSDPGSARR